LYQGPPYDEKGLLNELKQGNPQAFTRLYHLYAERLYGNLLKLIKHPEMAEEFLQEIFVLVWEKRQTIEIHSGFKAYLFRIGENKVYDHYRRLKRNQALFAYVKAVASEQYTHIEENLLKRENAHLLQSAIEALPPQRRQVFELCKIQGKSYQEVSSLLGISTSTINDHIVKATRSIRQFIYAHNKTTGLLLFAALEMLFDNR
jgi:RNA polymerase sigma-70 factor (ECF subfamily)